MEDEQAAKRARNSVDEEDVLDLIGGGEELGEEERDDNEDVQNAEDDEALEDELRVRQIEIDNVSPKYRMPFPVLYPLRFL